MADSQARCEELLHRLREREYGLTPQRMALAYTDAHRYRLGANYGLLPIRHCHPRQGLPRGYLALAAARGRGLRTGEGEALQPPGAPLSCTRTETGA